MRIVSLIASSTEIVYALGCGPQMVGRSHECDYPTSVRALPVLTEPKFLVDGSSAEIDARVKELLRHALSVYRVDPEKLAAVAPDVIITQSHCEVCAVSLRDVEEAVCTLIASRPRIVSLTPNGLPDLFLGITEIAEALDVAPRGRELNARLQARIDAISERARGLPKKTVAMIEWIEPLMAAGNWMPTLCELAGGISLFGAAGQHSPWMTFAELAARDPEVIVVLPCGFDIPRTESELPALTAQPGFSSLRAVKSGSVYLADGNQYFNRPGPRLVDSLEILAELLHPEVFAFGHRGTGYIPARLGS